METQIKKYSVNDYKKAIENMALFSWNVKSIDVDKKKATVTYERDENIAHYEEIKKLEKEWFDIKTLPLYPMFISAALAVICFTIFLIIAIIFNKVEFYIIFLSSCLPGIVFMLFTIIYYLIVLKNTKNAAEGSAKRMENVLLSLKELMKDK